MTVASEIERAAAAVARGELIACPTEAVYGLGCDPFNADALDKLLRLKGRDADKGFIVVAASLAQLSSLIAPLTASDHERMMASWPGPVTWVVPAAEAVPEALSGGRTTLAVRVTAHPTLAALCTACGHALVSTSANPSGQPPFRTAAEVRAVFGESLGAIVSGHTGGHTKVTSIFDLASGRQLR